MSNSRRTIIASGMGVRGTGKVKLGRTGVIASEHTRRLSISNRVRLSSSDRPDQAPSASWCW